MQLKVVSRMAFSTQKDFFSIPFMGEKFEEDCKKSCVKLKSYESTADERAWATDEKVQSRYLTDLLTCEASTFEHPSQGSEGDLGKAGAGATAGLGNVGIGLGASTGAADSALGSMAGGDSLLEAANMRLEEYQKLLNINTKLEHDLNLSNERLKTATDEYRKIREILDSRLDDSTSKDFYNKVQQLTKAGKLNRNEENEMLQIHKRLEHLLKAYDITRAENNHLRRIIEKMSNRCNLEKIKAEPERSTDINYLQQEVNKLREECLMLRGMEDEYQRMRQQLQQQEGSRKPISSRDAETIKAIIRERNSLRDKLKSFSQKVGDMQKKEKSLSYDLEHQSKYCANIEAEMLKMQKYYEDQMQQGCFQEECLKAQLEDLKEQLMEAKCIAQKTDILQMEASCLRNEILKRDMALSDYDCQYKQLMHVVEELQYKVQHGAEGDVCKTDELAFFTQATLNEIAKELTIKKHRTSQVSIQEVSKELVIKKERTSQASQASLCVVSENFQDKFEEIQERYSAELNSLKQKLRDLQVDQLKAANCEKLCADAMERIEKLQDVNDQLEKELENANFQNIHMNRCLKECSEKTSNMLEKLNAMEEEIKKHAKDSDDIGEGLNNTMKLVQDISDIQMKNNQLASAVNALNTRDDQKIIDDLRQQLEDTMNRLNKCQETNQELKENLQDQEASLKKLKDLNNQLEAEKSKMKEELNKIKEENDEYKKLNKERMPEPSGTPRTPETGELVTARPTGSPAVREPGAESRITPGTEARITGPHAIKEPGIEGRATGAPAISGRGPWGPGEGGPGAGGPGVGGPGAGGPGAGGPGAGGPDAGGPTEGALGIRKPGEWGPGAIRPEEGGAGAGKPGEEPLGAGRPGAHVTGPHAIKEPGVEGRATGSPAISGRGPWGPAEGGPGAEGPTEGGHGAGKPGEWGPGAIRPEEGGAGAGKPGEEPLGAGKPGARVTGPPAISEREPRGPGQVGPGQAGPKDERAGEGGASAGKPGEQLLEGGRPGARVAGPPSMREPGTEARVTGPPAVSGRGLREHEEGGPGQAGPGAGRPGEERPGAGKPGEELPEAVRPGARAAGPAAMREPGTEARVTEPTALSGRGLREQGGPGQAGPGAGRPGERGAGSARPGEEEPGAGKPGEELLAAARPGGRVTGSPATREPGTEARVTGPPGEAGPGAGRPGERGPSSARRGEEGPGAGKPEEELLGAIRPGGAPATGAPDTSGATRGALVVGAPTVADPQKQQPRTGGPGAGGPGQWGPGAGAERPGTDQPQTVGPGAAGPGTRGPSAGGPGVEQPRTGGPTPWSPGAGEGTGGTGARGPGTGRPELDGAGAWGAGAGGPGLEGARTWGVGAGEPGALGPQEAGFRAVSPGSGRPETRPGVPGSARMPTSPLALAIHESAESGEKTGRRGLAPSALVSGKKVIKPKPGDEAHLDAFVEKTVGKMRGVGSYFEKDLRKILDEFIQECGFCFCRLVNPRSNLYSIAHKLYHYGIATLSFRELAYVHKKLYARADQILPGCLLDMIVNEHTPEVKSILGCICDRLKSDHISKNKGEEQQKCCCCKSELCCNNSEDDFKEKVIKLERDIEDAKGYLEGLRAMPYKSCLARRDSFGETSNSSSHRSRSTKQFIKLKSRFVTRDDY
ncbi:uncharacterized protein ACN427_008880 [Glossina fuscipes fuscipes]